MLPTSGSRSVRFTVVSTSTRPARSGPEATSGDSSPVVNGCVALPCSSSVALGVPGVTRPAGDCRLRSHVTGSFFGVVVGSGNSKTLAQF